MTVILHLGTVLMGSSFLLIHGKDVGLVDIVGYLDVVGQLDVQSKLDIQGQLDIQ